MQIDYMNSRLRAKLIICCELSVRETNTDDYKRFEIYYYLYGIWT